MASIQLKQQLKQSWTVCTLLCVLQDTCVLSI
ncbi:uncharacterized protein METZ01_LOCUS367609, partial [marine metagenome]